MSTDDHVVNTEDGEWTEHDGEGERFEARRKQLGRAAGGEKLGTSLFEVPAGKTAWPRHAHLENEEAIFVLSGRGRLQIGDETTRVESGDYIALPPGGDYAHQLVNDSDEPIRYLCVSTMEEPEVIKYPDSDKIGVFVGAAPGGESDEREYDGFHEVEDTVGYWDGEE